MLRDLVESEPRQSPPPFNCAHREAKLTPTRTGWWFAAALMLRARERALLHQRFCSRRASGPTHLDICGPRTPSALTPSTSRRRLACRRTLYTPAGNPPGTVAERMPSWAGSFRPLKNANLVGSVTVVDVSESICSMTTCEWPVSRPHARVRISPPT